MGASRWTLPVPPEQGGSGPSNYCTCACACSTPIQVGGDAWRSGTRRVPRREERVLRGGCVARSVARGFVLARFLGTTKKIIPSGWA
eukprot:15463878-Alexandrium_andersonii.AAC.1